MSRRRLVLLAAEPGTLDQLLGATLPSDLELAVVSWDEPSPAAARLLHGCDMIVVGADLVPPVERLLCRLGGDTLRRALLRSPAGRLIDSFSPLHRSRRFAARVERHADWRLRTGDALVALDDAAALLAWRSTRRMAGITATLGLTAGLERLQID